MGMHVGVAGYLLVFGLVWGLLRYEFKMPRLISVTFGGLLVLMGVIAAAVGQAAGLGSMSSLSGVVAGVLVSLSLLLSIVS
jgi:hypothetical protein